MARNTAPAHTAPRWPEPREGQAAPRPDQARHPQHEQPYPHAQPPQPQFHPRQPHPGQYEAPEGYDLYAGYAKQGQPPAGYGHPAEPYPEQAGHGAEPQSGEQPGYPQPSGYAPQFERYQPPPATSHQHAPPAPEQGWAPEPAQQQCPPQQANAGYEPSAPFDQAGYGQAADPYPHPAAPPQLRGATYDHAPLQHQPQQSWPAPADDPYAEQQAWAQQQAYEQSYDPQGYAQPGYDPQNYDPQAHPEAAGYPPPDQYGYAQPAPYPEMQGAAHDQHLVHDPGFGPADGPYAPPQAQQDYDDQDYDPHEIAFEDDAPVGRSRLVKMAAAVVLAIGLGAGLAYGYKTLMGPSDKGKPPVVRNAKAPAKIKPDDPGGKKFAHTDSKILGRLSDAGSKPNDDQASDSSDSQSGGTRKVSTMVIGRDGSIVSTPITERAPPAQLPKAVSPVPGMTIVDGFGGRQPQVSPQPQPSAPAMINGTSSEASAPPPPAAAPAAPAAKAPAKPIIITRTEPAAATPQAPPNATASVAKSAAAEPKRVARATPPTAPATARATSAGYVAVLASIPRSGSSRMSALARFADLQQKYGAQLGGKTPDIQEANLGAKGTYHRLIVGPPGSRQDASRLCSQLKSAGYSGCWIKSY